MSDEEVHISATHNKLFIIICNGGILHSDLIFFNQYFLWLTACGGELKAQASWQLAADRERSGVLVYNL